MSRDGVAELTRAFAAGTDDPVRALQRCLTAAERGKADRALISLVPGAQADAEASRARHQQRAARGPLDGVPVVVKDCIDVAGMASTNGTKFLTAPVAEDSAVVKRLREAGAVVFAKANMHEFGIQPTGVNPHHGTPVNPWMPDRIPGGSSSGSAVSVATGIAPVAIGTDAGGSVRVPAALNGLVGLKPTFGAVPDAGIARLTEDLDHAGPIAWTVEDATTLFEVLAARKVDRGAQVHSAAVLADFFVGAEERVVSTVRDAISRVFGTGLPEVRTPATAWSAQLEFVLVGMQSANLIGPLLRDHGHEMGPDARFILQVTGAMPEVYRQRAIKGRAKVRAEFAALFEKHDVLLAPAVGSIAPELDAVSRKTGVLDTATMAKLAAVTFPANLAGLPCCAVPCFRDDTPVSLQIIGKPGDEDTVLAAAREVEQVFGARRPPRWHGAA